MRTVIVKTRWRDRQGGYWEAQAYTAQGQRLPSLYATMVHERAAVGQLVGDLMSAGYTHIRLDSQEPMVLNVKGGA